ncbi:MULTISPECIES: hypothetical protein [unclassified Myroides]|uniref:hypothetical protein n=1 Tax=unclassified Myroides TaxID=2642485 RepID=UPI0015FD8471|nr:MULTISPECIES: hypothetical protein [unclassified Myroides]MBB1149698.1 hypothetical protein [Myroides sp. NP-2]MDM1408678.1 hypothetical protein [Myroides sp. DF42-4-2]
MMQKFSSRNRSKIASLLFWIACPLLSFAQSLNQDEVTAVKMWLDEDGDSSLYIKVSAACNNYDSKRAFDYVGLPSSISLKLKNDLVDTTFVYEHPRFESSMLMFYSESVWFKNFEWKQAIFIPLFYCSQKHGATMPLSYLILFDQRMTVVHLTFQCKPEVWGSCKPVFKKRALKAQLTQLPADLQEDFVQYVEKTYTTREDLYPNHMTFKQKKYKDWNLASVVSLVEASYPHELLHRLHTFIEDQKWDLALAYLNEFEYLYVNAEGIVEIAGFRTSKQTYKEQANTMAERMSTQAELVMQQADQYVEQGDFQRAYSLYKAIVETTKP